MADITEYTTATYTFYDDGAFTCEFFVSLDGQNASMENSGTYEVLEGEDGISVALQYANTSYKVPIECILGGEACVFKIAGCKMYQQ